MKHLLLLAWLTIALSSTAFAVPCQDYFTAEWGKTLDMSSSEDINNSFPIFEKNDLSSYAFEGGVMTTTTTGTDSWFRVLTRAITGSIPDKTTRYGDLHPLNPAVYSQLIIRMYTDHASVLEVFWSKSDDTYGSSLQVATSTGWNTYTVDLNRGSWATGNNYGIRIDPSAGVTGATIKIDYIYITPAGCNNPDLNTAPILQPDREGGEDHYAAVRGNPANFDSSMDAEYIAGNSSATIYPSNAYTDSGSTARKQDYLQGVNNTSDPVISLTHTGTNYPIDASRYKIACYTFDIARPTSIYHSVARIVWQQDLNYYVTDDVLTKLTGEARYCLRMDSVALEPSLGGGLTHPWRNNADGTGLQILRFDPLEDTEATTYRFADFRLAADHESNTQFAIVVGGTRAATVDVQYQKVGGSRTAITTLPAGRSSDVVLWNTSALSEGTYYIYTVTGLNTSISEAPVVISHSRTQDSTAPVLHVDAPVTGHRFNNTLQVVGYALDNIRIATIEVHMDGQFIDTFTPSVFDARARDAYPQMPFTSEAGFNRSIDTSGWGLGSHTLTVTAYDTAGNSTSHSTTVTKAADNLTATFSPPFQEGTPIQLSEGLQPGAGGNTGTPRAKLTLKISKNTLTASASGKNCSSMRLFASTSANTQAKLTASGKLLQSVSGQSLKGSAKKIPRFNQNKKIYFLADCGTGSKGSVKNISTKSFAGKSTSSLKKVFNALVKYYKPS